MYYYIYLPGLGSEKLVAWQEHAIKKWNSSKRQAVLINPQWHNPHEAYEEKLQRIVSEIKNFMLGKDGTFCVVGSSAGGSMAINTHEKLQLDGAVLIAGKLISPQAIGASYNKRAPSLRDSVAHSQDVIASLTSSRKKTVLTINALVDEIIAKSDRVIEDVKNIDLLVPGHLVSIGYMLLLGKYKIFKWFEDTI